MGALLDSTSKEMRDEIDLVLHVWRLRPSRGQLPVESRSSGAGGGMTKRIYIAGPMTGLPQLNFPAFHAMASHLRSLGHHVVNPAEINVDPSAGWAECMRADIRELVSCTAICLLPGWEKSRGASLEHHIAQSLGFEVMTMEEAASMSLEVA